MFEQLMKKIRARLGMDLPTPRELLLSCQAYRHSPDAWNLSNFLSQHLFVPDEMMRGHTQHDRLEKAIFRGTGFTKHPYSAFIQRLGNNSHPIFLDDGYKPFPIKGELFLVPTSTLYAIDAYKQNVDIFIRRRVRIIIPYQEIVNLTKVHDSGIMDSSTGQGEINTFVMTPKQFHQVAAWMYFGNPNYWQIDGGYHYAPGTTFLSRIPEIGKYYFFSKAHFPQL